MRRDRTCEYPFCINIAPSSCPDCHGWLCSSHLQTHSCKRLQTWLGNSTALNALGREQFEVGEQADRVTVRLNPPVKRKPTRKEWRHVVGR